MISDLRYGVTVRNAKLINATTMRAVRARHGVLLVQPGHDVSIRPDIAKPSHGPAPLWSQDSGRRLLPGQSGAGPEGEWLSALAHCGERRRRASMSAGLGRAGIRQIVRVMPRCASSCTIPASRQHPRAVT
jgi:hypothetical protein